MVGGFPSLFISLLTIEECKKFSIYIKNIEENLQKIIELKNTIFNDPEKYEKLKKIFPEMEDFDSEDGQVIFLKNVLDVGFHYYCRSKEPLLLEKPILRFIREK